MPDALFDTTVFIGAHNGNEQAREVLARQRWSSARTYYSSVTVFELWLRRMARSEEAQHLASLSECIEAPFNSAAARIMASWLSSQPRSSRRRMLGDAMIAATAASLGATIYTRNPRDFTCFYADVESY